MKPLPESLRRLQAEVRGNPRLRWGLWVVLAIVWFYGVLLLRDAEQAAAAAYRQTSSQLARTRAVLAERDWPARLESARSVQLALESRLWREATVGLAQAALQDWLTQVVQQAGAAKPSVSVAAPPPSGAADAGGAEIWKVSGRVAFDFDPAALQAVLGRFASHPKQVAVETLTARSGSGGRVDMVVVAPFLKPGAPAAATVPRKAGP